jgi:catechol 2,3-dioxygenase-like lactoylglutathione lyase family enzyme
MGRVTLPHMRLYPIVNVSDQDAEREFYSRFGFMTVHDGGEFDGVLAIQHGEAIIGLRRASDEHPAYREGLRWQFAVDSVAEFDSIIAICRDQGLDHEVSRERGGVRLARRLVRVRTPSGYGAWFEGPPEAAD